MIVLKIAAFWLSMVGIGGIAGAVETGTSPVNAVAALILGCIAMAAYVRLDHIKYRRDKGIDRFIGKENRFCHQPKPQNLKDN